MNQVIIDEPHEILEVRPLTDPDSISIVQKRRANIMDEWNIKVIILNVKEAVAIHNAMANFIFSRN